MLLSLLIDRALGEPPARVHPVVWMGAAIGVLRDRAPAGPRAALGWGALALVLVAGGAATAGLAAGAVPGVAGAVLEIFLLSSTFAVRELVASAERVADALEGEGLGAGRAALSMIVSRDTAGLDAGQVAAGAVQSVTENFADSVVAPLFWYVLLGLPGALLLRAVNTLDAMIGYRGRYEHLGKVAARADDVLCWIPARLSAAALLAVAGPGRRDGLRVWWRDRRATPSPNGGHPMAAGAGILGVRLEKVGAYTLGDGPPPDAGTIRRVSRLVLAASALVGIAAAAARGALLGAWW